MSAPIATGSLSRDGSTVRIRCPHCGHQHIQGAAGIVDGSNPHRLAHCPAQPPRKATGYVVKIQEGAQHA